MEEIQDFLFIRNHGLGDLLMLFPAARAVHKRDPHSRVHLLTHPNLMELAKACPYIDFVHTDIESLPKTFQKSWDFNAAKFGVQDKHQIDAYLEETGLSLSSEEKQIELNITPSCLQKIDSLWKLEIENAQPNRGLNILIHAALTDPNRSWPEQSWRELIAQIQEEGHRVILTGSRRTDSQKGVYPLQLSGIVNLVDRLTPLEFSALCQKADLLISTDTGTIQLAAASEIAIAGIYTVVSGRHRLPYRHGIPMWNSISMEPSCPYTGCYRYLNDPFHFQKFKQHFEPGKLTPKRLFQEWCLVKPAFACLLHEITPQRVWNDCKNLLAANEAGRLPF